jgi:hypothetical protein
MRIPLKVYNKDSFYESWDLGSTMWVVDGNDGIRVFQREKFDDREKLLTVLLPYIKERQIYKVTSNYMD